MSKTTNANPPTLATHLIPHLDPAELINISDSVNLILILLS